jgi:hypothetical protein
MDTNFDETRKSGADPTRSQQQPGVFIDHQWGRVIYGAPWGGGMPVLR